jgi:4-carboxymuconolactone decarboxylase
MKGTAMRLPLVPEKQVSPKQRQLYDAFIERVTTTYSSFKTVRDDGALLGPWSVWIQIPELGEAVRQLTDAVEKMSGLSKATKQMVILITGAHFNAAYELYAHAAVGSTAGLTDAQIATLSSGERPADLDPEQTIAADVATALLRGGVLPGPVYKQAVAQIGQDGLNEIVFLVGLYCVVSCTLNAFDVPSEASEAS